LKIAALDVMFYDIPIEKRLKRIHDLGFEGTELWLGSAELGFSVEREWPDSHKFKPVLIRPEKLRKMAENAGIHINSFGQYTIMGPTVAPFPTEVVTGNVRKKRLEDIMNLLSYSAESGSRILICESGGDCDKVDQWKTFTEDFMRKLVDHAEKVGATLAMENTPHNLVKDENDLFKLMKIFNSKALRVAFDPANLNLTPPGKRDLVGAIRTLSDYIEIVHAKDSVYGGGPYGKMPDGTWSCPPIGKGTVPWKDCLQAFKQVGYDGWLIVEYSYPFKEVSLNQREEAAVEGKNYLTRLIDHKAR